MAKKAWRLVAAAGLAGVLAAGLSCSGGGMTVDGSLEEWSSDSAARADGHSLYLRFRVPGEASALQASDRTVALYLDADASGKTGRVNPRWKAPLNTLGIDGEIVFSPRTADGKPGRGIQVRAVGGDGAARTLPAEASGLVFSPTYASDWYEMKLDRGLLRALGTEPATGGGGRLVGMFVTLDAAGKVNGYADPFEVALPPSAGATPPATVDLPVKPAGAVRLVSFNVEKSKPTASPAPFARILTALDPDVLLIQEWDEGDGAALEAWIKQHAQGLGHGWSVRKTDGAGVAVASRLPLAALAPDSLWMSDGSDKPRLVRVAAASVTTPRGVVAFASVHLKCCGGASSREETLRRGEAKAIHDMIAGLPGGATGVVIGGDFNLVGTREPLELLRDGLDAGQDLAVTEPLALGGDVKATWRDWSSGFSPGRLDFVLSTPSTLRTAQAFVLDTAVLSDESLARMGLDRADGATSDHLPVVVDLLVGK